MRRQPRRARQGATAQRAGAPGQRLAGAGRRGAGRRGAGARRAGARRGLAARLAGTVARRGRGRAGPGACRGLAARLAGTVARRGPGRACDVAGLGARRRPCFAASTRQPRRLDVPSGRTYRLGSTPRGEARSGRDAWTFQRTFGFGSAAAAHRRAGRLPTARPGVSTVESRRSGAPGRHCRLRRLGVWTSGQDDGSASGRVDKTTGRRLDEWTRRRVGVWTDGKVNPGAGPAPELRPRLRQGSLRAPFGATAARAPRSAARGEAARTRVRRRRRP